MHVRALVPVDRWAVGFSINTVHGQMALASNTDVLGVTLDPITDEAVVRLTLTEIGLAPGEYFVNANAAGISVASSHSLTHGASFVIEGPTGTIGPVSASIRYHDPISPLH